MGILYNIPKAMFYVLKGDCTRMFNNDALTVETATDMGGLEIHRPRYKNALEF